MLFHVKDYLDITEFALSSQFCIQARFSTAELFTRKAVNSEVDLNYRAQPFLS